MKKIYSVLAVLSCFALNAKDSSGFIRNEGQYVTKEGDPRKILFKSTNADPQIFVTTEGLTYVFHGNLKKSQDENYSSAEYASIDMKLDGAAIASGNIVCENELPGVSNFYYPHCPQGILNVKTYTKITIRNIYEGIDWIVVSSDAEGTYQDFIVHAGADASKIKVSYAGMKSITVNDKGELVLETKFGKVTEGKVNSYFTGTHVPIKSSYRQVQGRVFYTLPARKYKSDINIDPPLTWASNQASSDFDYGYACNAAPDGTGDILVTGTSMGTNFPTMNAYQGSLYGFQDMVIFRLNSAGTRLWSTYYGGLGDEDGKGISSDNSGNAYVVGTTGSSDMPVVNNTQAAYGGGTWDVAVMKFSSTGVRQWATWYGGLQADYGMAITVDASGNNYFTGYTNSTTFPTLFAPQSSKGVGNDAFLSKFDNAGTPLWSTFYGGDDEDKGRGICLDASGSNVFITGSTLSGVLNGTSSGFQTANASAYNFEDAFILKMSSAHVAIFASYFGGSDAEFGQGIAVDVNGNVFVTGRTSSSDLPLLSAGSSSYMDGSLGNVGTADAFMLECNSAGNQKIWSTYFGGGNTDMGLGISYDPFVGIFVCGNSASTDFPVQQPSDLNYYQNTQGDGGNYYDMFAAWFDTNDSLRWSTYYGGSTSDEAFGVSVDNLHNIFVTGVDSSDIRVLKFGNNVTTGAPCNIPVTDDFVFPVPATDMLHLSLYSGSECSVEYSIYDERGALIVQEVYAFDNGRNDHAISIGDLPKGNYLLRYAHGLEMRTVKFTKE